MTTTLLCWCRDDDEVSAAAREYKADYRYSGCRRAALRQLFERLKTGDILIITAHGTPRILGDEDDSFSDLTVQQLAEQLLEKAPKGWSGKLYFDICNGYAFAKNLRPKIQQAFPDLVLYGCVGDTDMEVDLTKHKKV